MKTSLQTRGSIVRVALFVLIGGWIVLSPAYRQVFGGTSNWFPRWVMFHGFGRAVCDVRFFEVIDDGGEGPARRLIDRFEVLGKERSWSTNKSLVRMSSKADVRKVGRRLCSALGDGADVRALARCGSRDRWKAKLNAKTKLCGEKSSRQEFSPGDYR
jgi:hypothetical protein